MHSGTLLFTRPRFHRYILPSPQKRQICWFFSRITWYSKKNCTFAEAIDFAIDDCLVEGIFYSLFMRRREEIKEQILRSSSSVLTAFR